MPVDVVVGLQWGDEGKGKYVDWLAGRHRYEVVARYQGGPNAGHTVCADGRRYVFHLVPSGVLNKDVRNVLGNGVVIDISKLRGEIEELRRQGIEVNPHNLFVSGRAHVIMPYHLEEEGSGLSRAIGTTKNGIGPAYTSKTKRTGIRVCDLEYIRESDVRERVLQTIKGKYSSGHKVRHPLRWLRGDYNPKRVLSEIERDFEYLRPFVCDTSLLLDEWLREGRHVLAEGAQGTLLDVDHGSYPFVTSSSSTAGGAPTGLGIGPSHITEVIGVTKAYTTRVGNGPFPTEMDPKTAEQIRSRGKEFGATTNRSRRCGWLDMVALRFAERINGIDKLAVMKVDVLSNVPQIQVATFYELNGHRITEMPSASEILQQCTPHYESFRGWDGMNLPRHLSHLPDATREYLEYVERALEVPIAFVSVGSDRDVSIENQI